MLPPYSPELNPVENVWQYLRANWLAISVFDDYDAIVDACCAAWNRFAEQPEILSSITCRQWAQVSPEGQRLPLDNGIARSMSRAGNVWDTSAMESFFSSLKTDRTTRKVYRMRGLLLVSWTRR